MFIYSSVPTNRPRNIKGTIKFKRMPECGRNTDIDGKVWDVHAIVYGHVYAVPIVELLYPYYNSTDIAINHGVVHQSWSAYKFEVEK